MHSEEIGQESTLQLASLENDLQITAHVIPLDSS